MIKNPIIIFYVLVFYVFAQFSWWWYLIFKLNHALVTEQEFFSKKIWMIAGEGIVFFILLIIGIIAVKKAFKKQINLAKREENFLLSVSHELKTPIASVQLFLQTLEKHQGLDTQKRNEIYSNALHEVKRLDDIVSNILLARQIEGGNSFLHKEQINVTEFISLKIKIFNTTISKKHKLIFNSEIVEASIDKISLDSILTNLVQNSVKYSEKDSKVTIDLLNNKDSFILKVSDQGIGIKSKDKSQVFKKFFREQSDLTRHTKGTGLGLFIVKHLIELHKGKITIQNNKPKGTIVEIEIPK